jgi:hypothetical protein
VQAFVSPEGIAAKLRFPTLKPSHRATTQFLIWIIFLIRKSVTRCDVIWTRLLFGSTEVRTAAGIRVKNRF